MEQTYDCCPVLTEFVLLDNVLSNLDAPVDILAASHVSQLWRTVMLRRLVRNPGQSKWPHFTHEIGRPENAGDGEAAIGAAVVAAAKRWVAACGIIPQVCVLFVAESEDMEPEELESFTAELKTVLPPNTAFWGSAAEAILSGSGEYVTNANPAITMMLIPRSDAFRASPFNVASTPTKQSLAAMFDIVEGAEIVHAKVIVGASTPAWINALVANFRTRCEVSVSGGITGSELASPLLLKDGTPFAGATILMFSKPARSAFCAAGFAIQGGHSALDDENKVRDVTMKTCYENFVEAQPEGTLANVAGAISVSCVGRIGLEENKTLARQLDGATVVGIFGQGELGNVSRRYMLDEQRFTDTEGVVPEEDVQWHGYTNFCHFFGDSGQVGEASPTASSGDAPIVA